MAVVRQELSGGVPGCMELPLLTGSFSGRLPIGSTLMELAFPVGGLSVLRACRFKPGFLLAALPFC